MKDLSKILILGIFTNMVSHGIIQSLSFFNVININKFIENIGVNLIIFYVLVAIIIFLIVLLLGKEYYKKKSREPSIIGGYYRPNHINGNFIFENYGVLWKGVVGSARLLGNEFAYVDGAFCPKCDCELDDRTRGGFFRLTDKRYWECPNCGLTYEKPDISFHNMETSIEKIAMNSYKKQQSKKKS